MDVVVRLALIGLQFGIFVTVLFIVSPRWLSTQLLCDYWDCWHSAPIAREAAALAAVSLQL